MRDDPFPDEDRLPRTNVDLCLLPMDAGECRAYIPSYYYDYHKGICKEFVYGGCGGNANRFETADECATRCARRQQGRRELSRSFYADESPLEADDNANRNEQLQEVTEEKQPDVHEDDLNDEVLRGIDYDEKKVLAIQHGPLSPFTLPELCGLPEEHGSCYDDILRWRFDPEKKSCTSFMYGGCDMNANHFTSEEDCERACGSWRSTAVCSLPPEIGHCDASVSKWYYDKAKDSCTIMYWTGCGGNGNRFSSREDCESLCREESAWEENTDVCKMPRSSGPCRDAISMWYFDSSDETCKQFTYSGCRGNENRFSTKERCERKCIDRQDGEDFDVIVEGDGRTDKVAVQLKANSDKPYKVGEKIELTCDSQGLQPIVWRKDGHLLHFTKRVQEHDQFARVNIARAVVADSGDYQCAAGTNGVLSNAVAVAVIPVKRDEVDCTKDGGTRKTCTLILEGGWSPFQQVFFFNLTMCIPKKSGKSDKDHKSSNKKDEDRGKEVDSVSGNNKKFSGSFKVSPSSQPAMEKVQHWVNRALDIGVPGLMQEFRYNLAKWNPQNMTVDAFLANRDKNRYLDVPCQDQGRVTVKWPGLPNDYIHANYVAHPTTNNRFVCSQGPLDNTQLAFWAMVIQEKSEIVIMLCNTIECGKFKCSQYWPREKGETMTFGEGPGLIMVTNLDVRPMSAVDNFVRVCILKLDYFENDKPKSTVIRHFQWENWPDRGVPPTKFTATNMLSEIRGTTKPIVVHCSAGIGRTGTIVAIAYVQERMNYGQECADMDVLTKELRSQRPFSIQNEYQYIYAHRVLLAYFLEKYRNRFAHILAGDGEAKYAKWREQYKEATGCD
ncbi:hypothetical protein RB195_015732 [Necator americanus]|uniref:Protein-tyrosine-phosphatase n=1 Tax=Necator americanus TaxID=51031 RepID=A0ABR1E620_NECAM